MLYVTGEIEIVILFHQGPVWLRYSNEREITPAINNNRDNSSKANCAIHKYVILFIMSNYPPTGTGLISLVKYLL